MNCNFSINLSKASALKALKDYYGENEQQYLDVIDKIVDSMDAEGNLIPTKKFNEWYKQRYKGDVNFDSGTGAQLRDRIINYIKETSKSAEATARANAITQLLGTYGYTSPSARILAKRIIANFVLETYHKVEHKVTSNSTDYEYIKKEINKVGLKSFYFNEVFTQIEDILIDRIAEKTGEDVDTILDKIDTEKRAYVEKALGGKHISVQDSNLIALYFEINTNPTKFVDEVCLDSRLGDIRFTKEDEFHDENERAAVDAQASETNDNTDETSTQVDDDTDVTIAMYDHSGTYTTAMMHVGMNIKSYFNSLRKLNSSNLEDFNTNNELGIADTMNADECVTVLYHYGDYSNVTKMIQSIKDIANTIPGCEAFHTLYYDLNNNLDFAFELYDTFGKAIISKVETIVRDGKTETRIRNTRSNKNEALSYEFMNSVKATALSNDKDSNLEELTSFAQYISNPIIKKEIIASSDNEERKEAVKTLYNLLRRYYPTINQYAVENYIKFNKTTNGDIDIEHNFSNLITILRNTIKTSIETKTSYRNRQIDISNAKRHNDNLINDQVENGKYHSDNEFIDLNPLYAASYISSAQTAAAIELANELANYSLVQVEINSTNVKGNQSSDIINNSFLTNLIKTLQNDIALGNYGKYKFQSHQYDFSNILFEEPGVHKGIFRRDEEGNIVPTEYAKTLLSIRLFDGASNLDTDEDVLYREMSEGDYIGTAYINFFKKDRNGKSIDTADYFMRTPSDAPRNYIVTAPKYSTEGLFVIANENKVNAAKRALKVKVTEKFLTTDDLNAAANAGPIKIWYSDQMVRHLLADDGTISVKLPDYIKSNQLFAEGSEVIAKFQYNPSEEKNDNNIYLIKGVVENGRLNYGTFLGVFEDKFSQAISTELDEQIDTKVEKSGIIQYTINKNHPIFKQFKNVFKQELLDAATAINKFFFTRKDGLVYRYDATEAKAYGVKEGDIKWKPNTSTNGNECPGCYENYHHKKGKIIEVKDGIQTLVGNVFHSDRFIIFDEEGKEARNYGEEILTEAFNLLYGGPDNTFIHTKKDVEDVNGKVTEVILTSEQERVIDDKLYQFITDYVNQGFNKLEARENSLLGEPLTHQNASDFLLNYHLMYINFGELFEGDTKFYKTSQDFLKRAKEVQGSGVPYGCTDYELPINERQEVRSRLDGIEFLDKKERKLYSTFRAATIVNTVKSNDVALKAIKKKLMSKTIGLSEEQADKLLEGYKETTVNDAQSYITFDEWIRRITARGQLMKHMPLINKIMSGEELNAEELLNFVQVQKNFYYDQYYDEEANIIVPRQIKNAEFVLVPQLIKGTELEVVAQLMANHNIDQLNTAEASKAGKSDILEIFDAKTGKVKEDIIKEVTGKTKALSEFSKKAKGAIHNYNYTNLYTQQETPQHVNAQNKAGIQIMKKILDNIAPKSKFYPVKERFFKLYSANIRDSFRTFMDELGVKLDDNGNIELVDDGFGNKTIAGLNTDIFYQRLKDEIVRLGIDSNMMDYVTIDETTGAPIMPNYISMVMQKMESISQSLFNSRITRQKLPGFHAAQISNVGWTALAESKEQVSYSKDLKYHIDDNGNYVDYVEIMLPASAFGFKRQNNDGTYKTKDELLKELQNEGLDYLIGYRIPTEGKQSVCKMRVVGFIDDANGSTIVVPNEWVAQTGSDFDIDSVYGITFSTYIDKQGKIRKHQYLQDKRDLYKRYVLNNLTKEEVIQAFEEAKAGEETIKQIKEKNKDKNTKYFDKDNFIAELKDYSKDALFGVLEDIAEEKGFKSYEEYAQGDFTDLNNRNARNNELLRCMLAILGSDEALEENLSRSNFEDIINARNKIYDSGDMKIVKARRDARSPYNFLDQAAFQDDTMSGAKLKAFSVTRDTFCSICNTVRPTVSKQHQIRVIYSNKVISYEDAVKRYGKENVEKDKDNIIITHNMFGWSNDNKNVVGKILTAYSSQTTAHILDAVKEGAIPNVNDLTFAVYKLFPDLGIDYDTAVAFMMQDGVTRIVDAYNSTKSIYQRDKADPIVASIKQIAIELGYTDAKYTSVENILKRIARRYAKDFINIFGDNAVITLDDDKIASIPIDGEVLHKELSNPRKGNDKLLFDLGIILQYSKLSHLSTAVGNLAKVCNPDKFGAKQTIYATNKVFDDIKELIYGDNPIPLNVDGKDILRAIYPNIEFGLDEFISSPLMESKYPPLYNFLKYSTATSIKINRTLFETQSVDFIAQVRDLQSVFSDEGKLTEKQYKEYEKYIIGYLYNDCQTIMRPVTFKVSDEYTGFVPIAIEKENIFDKNPLFEEEKARVFGYSTKPDETVTINDVANPKPEEIAAFAKLSPAQKVAWVQENFDDAGVFKYLRTTLFNERATRGNKAGSQTVEFVDTTINIEDIYNEFTKCFVNTNPLIALTAYDIVKYAFIVEGYKMKKNGVSKIIPNSILYNDFGIFGTGIIAEMQGKMATISQTLADSTDILKEDFIRSHNIQQIPSIKVEKIKGKSYELARRTNGFIQITKDEEGYEIAEKYRIVYRKSKKEEYKANSYIKLRFGNKEVLYRIKDNPLSSSIYLYPLNKLEENEHGAFSANPDNNKYASQDFYERIIAEYDEQYRDFDAKLFKEIAEQYDITAFKSKTKTVRNPEHFAKDFSVVNPSDDMIGAVDKLNKDIQVHYGDNESARPLIEYNAGLGKKIRYAGAINGLTKTFVINKGKANERIIKLNIYKLSPSEIRAHVDKYLGPYNSEKTIVEADKDYANVIAVLRSNKVMPAKTEESRPAYYNDLYIVEPYRGEILKASTITEVGVSLYKAINQDEDYSEFAAKAKRRLKDRGITTNKDSVSNHIDEVIRTEAEYVASATEKIINKLKYFAENPNGEGYLSVTDPGVIDLIRHTPELVNKYLQTILEAEKIVKNCKIINELDIISQDPELRRYLEKIKQSINDLQNNPLIRNAKELFANEYLAKLSEDPRIQRDILNILDGYNSTNSFTAWVNDLQETTSPFIQVLSKHVLADIHAKELEATRKVRALRDFLKQVKNRANAAGKTINFDNIIDADGRFIQEYTQELVDDMTTLREDMYNAKAQYGEGSLEHLEATLKYNKWKLEHINQELDDDYYRRKIALDETILYGEVELDPFTGMPFEDNRRTGGHAIVLTEYKKLSARRRDILSHVVNGVLDEYWTAELDKVNKQINNLITPLYHDPITGELRDRETYDEYFNPITGTEEEKKLKILYSAASQRALTKYIQDVKNLNNEYHNYETEFGFEEELARNLHIINSYEKRDANGNITVPMNILIENDEYVRAKEWVQANAHFIISAGTEADQELITKLNDAFKALAKEGSRKVLRTLAKTKEAYDAHGVIDGTKFTDEEIEKIREEQQIDYNIHEEAPYSDKTLISNAAPTNEIYTSEFYKQMVVKGENGKPAVSNPQWLAKVHEINELLAPYYDNATKTIRFDLVPNTDEGRALFKKLEKLYLELDEIKKTVNGTNNAAVRKFIENEVEFKINEEAFEAQKALALTKGNENSPYMQAWRAANTEIVDGKVVPNHYIYGYAVPKNKEKYLDKKRTDAINLLNEHYTITPTEYYYQKVEEVKKQGKETFTKWYNENHIYNPYNHEYEPLRCWTTYTLKDTSPLVGKWEAKASKKTRVANEDRLNPNYKQNVGHAQNYKKGTGYDNPAVKKANEFEREVKREFERIISELVKTKLGKAYIDKGYLPSRVKPEEHDAKFYGKEIIKSLGWVEGHSGKDPFYDDGDVDYARDRVMAMPMLGLLNQKSLEQVNLTPPVRENYNSDAEYNTALTKYNEEVDKLKEENKKAHQDVLDRNWEEVMADFILRASHYNAVQDNKLMLFYGRSMLENIRVYQRQYGFFGDYKKDYVNSDDTTTDYIKRKDENLIKQYENWIRRIVYDQWKERNAVFTKWASRLQSLTSAQYMMLNVRGGIANVTLGETNIIAEAFAKEYFGKKDWLKGITYLNTSIPSFFANMNKNTSTSVADAIVKFMNVIDFDELTGKSRIVEDPVSEGFRRFRSFAFSTLTMGEFFMQNSAMFSMMMSHRLYEELDDDGNRTIKFKNEAEAMRNADIDAIRLILPEDKLVQFNEFVAKIKKDANTLKDYAWFRKDFVTEFAQQYLTNEEKKQYIAKRKELQKKAKDEFNDDTKHPTLISQFALAEDQQLGFKQGSKLSEYDIPNENGEPSEAYKLLANFRGRVISVNKKIHGVYDRLGQAQLEKLWYGSLVMQYHKHMYPGILKRWRREGSFNEQRGTIEKGSYIALKDFLATPWRKYKAKLELNDAQVETLEGIQNFFGEVVNFVTSISLNWNLLPEHERANIKRILGDICGVMSAIFLALAIRVLADDDDEDGIVYNLALYEADRLASESFQFNPIGMWSEARKLWSTPIAAQSGVQDLIQSAGLLAGMIMDGDDFDPYYHSGRFAGQHKLRVYIERRIPIWRGIKTGFVDIAESNKYYKIGDNMLSRLPIAHWAEIIRGDETDEN